MKRILVTGAGGGIGRATVKRFLVEHGSTTALVLNDVDESALADIAREARDGGATVETVAGDLVDPSLPARLLEVAKERFHGLDIVVSNAGMTRRGLLVDQNEENWDRVMDVNVRAFWRIAQASYDVLRSSRGSVVSVASIAAVAPNPGTGFYSASKAALLSLVTQLGLEWAADGIRVNAVSPGVTLTPLNSPQYEDTALKSQREGLVPLKRFASPEEIAAAIVFLAGPGAQFCQGYNMVVDGGLLPSVLAHSLPPVGARASR